eukprot:gene28446-35298_t
MQQGCDPAAAQSRRSQRPQPRAAPRNGCCGLADIGRVRRVLTTVEAAMRVDALSGGGTVRIGYPGHPASLTVGVNNFLAGTYNAAGTSTFSGNLEENGAGLGVFIKLGTGTQIMTGQLNHSGATTISGGTLQWSDGSPRQGASVLASAISNQGSLVINRSDDVTLSGAITGTGSLAQQGTGTLTLTGADTLSGNITVSGGTLKLGGTGYLGANANYGGSISLAAGTTLEHASTQAQIFSGVISGAGRLVQSVSNLTLSAANTYTGETLVAGGTLTLGVANALGAAGNANNTVVEIADVATLNANGLAQRIGALQGAGTLTLGTSVFTVGGNNSSTRFTGTFSSSGSGVLVKEGTGTFTLGGAVSNTGRAVVNAGTLVLDKASGTNAVNALGGVDVVALDIKSGATARLAGAGQAQLGANSNVIVNSGATLDTNGQSLTLNSLSGSGQVINNLGNSTTVLTLGNYNASFTLNTLLANGGAGATGLIALSKVGSGTLTLGVAQSYSGVTTVHAGSITFSAANLASRSSDVVLNTSTNVGFNLAGFAQSVGSIAGNGAIALGAATLTVGGTDASTRYTGVISGAGGALVKTGSGTLVMTGAQTYTGSTTVSAGTLQLADGAALTLPATSAVVNNARLVFSSSSALSLAANWISGTGTLVQRGTGVLTFNGANSYSGGTVLEAGTIALATSDAALGTGSLQVQANASLKAATGAARTLGNAVSVASGAALTLDAAAASLQMSANVGGAGSLVVLNSGVNAAILAGDASLTGAVTVNAGGTLQVGAGGSSGSLNASGINNAGTLKFSRSNNSIFAAPVSGTGVVTKEGAGALTVSGVWSHTGATNVNGGSLVMGAAQRLSASSAVAVAAASVLDLASFSQTLSTLSGSGAVTLGSATLSLGHASTAATFSGVISGSGGLSKSLGNIQTLSGANTYTGATSVADGGLTLSGGSNRLSASTDVSVASGATLTLSGTAASTERMASLSGAGSVVLGATVLTVGAGNASSSYSGTISGTGGLIKEGTGVLTLKGPTSSFSGSTTVNGGTLDIGRNPANNSVLTGPLVVNTGATLAGNGTVGASTTTVNSGATLSPGSTDGPAGAGPLNISGILVLASGSTLQLHLAANGDSLADDEITGVSNLTLGGTVQVGGLSSFSGLGQGTWSLIKYSGTLTGTLSALTLGNTPGQVATGSAYSLLSDGPNKSINLRLAPASSTLQKPPFALRLAAADDTGLSNSDGITGNSTALTISGIAEDGTRVWLFDDQNNDGVVQEGELLSNSILPTAGTRAFSQDIALGSGTHFIRAVSVDATGVLGTPSNALVITVDLMATNAVRPGQVLTDPALNPTGLTTADDRINTAFPTVRFGLPVSDADVRARQNAQAGDVFEFRNGTTVLARKALTAQDIAQGYVDVAPDRALVPNGLNAATYQESLIGV